MSKLGVTVADAHVHGPFGPRLGRQDEPKDELWVECPGELLERLSVRPVRVALQA